jgi:hypothetical protein
MTLSEKGIIGFGFIFLVTISGLAEKNYFQKSFRIKRLFNADWKFKYFGWEENLLPKEIKYDDKSWKDIATPHTWNAYEYTGDIHPYRKIHGNNALITKLEKVKNEKWEGKVKYVKGSREPTKWEGWGWYRKHFMMPESYSGKKVFFESDGIQVYSKIWINGQYVGDHAGGYSSFSFEITPYLHFGKDNVIAIEVNNDPVFKRIPPMYAGNWNVYGGMHRKVWLVITDKLYIPFQGSADHEGGTFVTTPYVNEKEARVNILTYVKNSYDVSTDCEIVTRIVNRHQQIIDEIRSSQEIQPGEIYQFNQTSQLISNPHLWSPDYPYLYTVYTAIYKGEKAVDSKTSPLGFRWFKYVDRKLYLNGQYVHCHGVNRHEDYPWLGSALPDWIHKKDYIDIKSMGCNFLRTAHYPQAPIVYDLLDSLGIITVEELPCNKKLKFDPDIKIQMTKEMVRRDRNHPSILIWSVGNETDDPARAEWVLNEDSTRLTYCRNCGEDDPDINSFIESEVHRVTTKVLAGDYMAESEQADALSKSYIDEYGAHWVYNDFGCNRNFRYSMSIRHIDQEGWTDMYRRPKYAYYAFKAYYSKEPVIYIRPQNWSPKNWNARRMLTVNTNCDSFVIVKNGMKSRVKIPVNAYWAGYSKMRTGTLTAQGWSKGKIVTHEVVMSKEPTKLVLSVEPKNIPADRSGIALVTVKIVDDNNIDVLCAVNTIEWSIEGPGTLIGYHTYVSQLKNHPLTVDEGTGYTDCPTSIPIRSTNEPGIITIKANSAGLESAQIQVVSEIIQK